MKVFEEEKKQFYANSNKGISELVKELALLNDQIRSKDKLLKDFQKKDLEAIAPYKN